MRTNERFSAPDGFRHQTRTLEAGESIPRVPSLFEQLSMLGGMTISKPSSDPFVTTPNPLSRRPSGAVVFSGGRLRIRADASGLARDPAR